MGPWRSRFIEGANEADMARFSVDLEVANGDDLALARRGALPPDQIRRVTLKGIVDTGAARLVLPAWVVEKLDLPDAGTTRVRYADHRRAERRVVQQAQVYLLGRTDSFQAIVEPDRDDALVGALVLETFDLLVDPFQEKILPRDPAMIISEIE
jgi:predicted aspartyl protease